MDQQEVQVLSLIQENTCSSQRDIALASGLSLGTVNILLKRFARVGYVQVEQLSGKKVRYMLTPSGFNYLTKKTISYVKTAYTTVVKMQEQMAHVIAKNFDQTEVVLINGDQDEVGEILTTVLKRLGYQYRWIDERNATKALLDELRCLQWQGEGLGGIWVMEKPDLK